jgi:hypothetical protein
MSVTLPVLHLPRGWLNELALQNLFSMLVTDAPVVEKRRRRSQPQQQPAQALPCFGTAVRVNPHRVRAPRRRVEGSRHDAMTQQTVGGVGWRSGGLQAGGRTRSFSSRSREWCCPFAGWCCRPHCADERERSGRRAGGRRAEGAAQSTALAGACARRSRRHSLAHVLEGVIFTVVKQYARRSRARPDRSCGRRPRVFREAAESRRRRASAWRPSGPRPGFARGAAGGPQHTRRGTLRGNVSRVHGAEALGRRAARRRPWPAARTATSVLDGVRAGACRASPRRSSSSWRSCGRAR